MSDSEKMSALDFVISVLKEHEKALDSIVEKLDNILKNVPQVSEKTKPVPSIKSNINISCKDWIEFREACSLAETISYIWDEELKIKALQGNTIYEYEEQIPRHAESMDCGIRVKFQNELDTSDIRRVLAKELNVQENKIVHGDIHFS